MLDDKNRMSLEKSVVWWLHGKAGGALGLSASCWGHSVLPEDPFGDHDGAGYGKRSLSGFSGSEKEEVEELPSGLVPGRLRDSAVGMQRAWELVTRDQLNR